MRPIKLTISAFGPYAGKEVLNMDDLGEKGLYLITGATGAGKTSVFDAIAYALYDQPSGNIRDDSMLRSKYADGATETFVELEFICKGKTYTVRRNPEYDRPKTRGDGFTKQLARAELRYPDGRIVDKSKREVTAAIEEIIGVNRDQFSQIAMIAQGDFRKVLLATTEERKKIFRQIFKTHKYEKIQDRLKEEIRLLNGQLSLARNNLQNFVNTVECDGESIFYPLCVKAKEEIGSSKEIIGLLEEVIKEDEGKREGVSDSLSAVEKSLEIVNANVAKGEEYAENKRKYEEQKALLPLFAERYDEGKKTLDLEKEKLPLKEETERQIALLEEEISRYELFEKLQREVAGIERKIKLDEKEVEEYAQGIEKTKADIAKGKEKRKALENAGEKKEGLEGEQARLEKEKEELASLEKEWDLYKTVKENLAVKQEEYKKKIETAAILTEKYNTLYKNFLDGQAGVMASRLTIGEPCPVCGSITHPNLAKTSLEVPTELELKESKKAMEDGGRDAENKSKECAEYNGKAQTLEKSLQGKSSSLFGESELKKLFENLSIRKQAVEEKLLKNAKAIAEEKANIEQRKRIDEWLEGAEEKLLARQEYFKAKSEELASDRATYKQKAEQLATQKTQLRYENRLVAEGKLKELRVSREAMKKALENAEKAFDESKAKLVQLQGVVATLEQVVKKSVVVDLQAEKEKREQLSIEKKKLQEKKEEIASRLKVNALCLQNVISNAKTAEKTEERYKWLNTLSTTASGELGGKEKISFETYVQATYFDRILRRANIRLRKMTDGQFDMVRRENPLNKRSQVGLDIDVIDHADGSIRPVNTLSGGQQFLASLSLALGLSDEIQSSAGGVKLDTMFVDEGFGSLDGDCLRLAISALQDLTEGNRLVGIISHVEELKNKIDKQILVEKKKGGENGSHARIL